MFFSFLLALEKRTSSSLEGDPHLGPRLGRHHHPDPQQLGLVHVARRAAVFPRVWTRFQHQRGIRTSSHCLKVKMPKY